MELDRYDSQLFEETLQITFVGTFILTMVKVKAIFIIISFFHCLQAIFGSEDNDEESLFEGDIRGVPEVTELANRNISRNYANDHEHLHIDTDNHENLHVDKCYNPQPWPDNIIPYIFNGRFPKQMKRRISEMMIKIQNSSCVQFKPHEDQETYMQIRIPQHVSEPCTSAIGYQQETGARDIYLGSQCSTENDILHELMHALGFFHEHNRYDRERFVKINFTNIKKNCRKKYYHRYCPEPALGDDQYDFNSVTHYPPYADAINKNVKTIRSISGTQDIKVNGLSEKDIQKINRLYKCEKYRELATITSSTMATSTFPNMVMTISMEPTKTRPGKQECLTVRGRVGCAANTQIIIKLVDEDGTSGDDPMDETYTDNISGFFQLAGCASDPIGHIDPELHLYHNCKGEDRRVKLIIPEAAIGKVYTFTEIINLDGVFQHEEKKKYENGNGEAINFHNCKSQWELKEVRMNGCTGEGDSCPLKKGKSREISVKFVPNRAAENLTVSLAIIMTEPYDHSVPFPLPNENACVNSGLTCPLIAGHEYTYKLTVPMLDSSPNVNALNLCQNLE